MPRFAHKECYRWLRCNFLAQVWLVTRNHLLNKTRVKRSVYNCKNANWSGLKELLLQTPRPWDMVFVPNDVDESFCKWCNLFISAVDDQIDEANLLNHCFHAVFSPPDLHPSTELTTLSQANPSHLSNVQLTVAEVADVLRNLDPKNACGIDGIPGRLQVISNHGHARRP